jgi:hypothetical protein
LSDIRGGVNQSNCFTLFVLKLGGDTKNSAILWEEVNVDLFGGEVEIEIGLVF